MHLPETTMSGSGSWMPGYNTSTNRYTLAGTGYDSKGELLNDTFHIADIVRDRDFSALTLENVPNLLSFIDLPNL